MERYLSLSAYLTRRFGKKLYKLPLSSGLSCPNRDGTLSHRGCIFCAEGSGAFCASPEKTIPEQLAWAKALVENKLKNAPHRGYIAYFQSYTNTYAAPHVLEPMFAQAMSDPQVEVLSVATRPDCLSEDTVALLSRLNQQKPVWVELGLQTANDRTARLLNRGYPTRVYVDACRRLRSRGIEVITHLILGLPEETEEDLLASVKLAGEESQGVKLQLLHVLRDTPLAQMPYLPLSREEYLRLLALAVEHLPPHCVIHRLTGDGDKKRLIAPLWSGDKKTTLNAVKAYFEAHDVRQGKHYEA